MQELQKKVWYAVDATMDDPFMRMVNFDRESEREPGWDIVEGF